MKARILPWAVLALLIFPATAQANNLVPTAVFTPTSATKSWFYHAEVIAFNGSSSHDNDENGNAITYYWWQVKIGSGGYSTKKSGSTASGWDACFELGGTAYATTGNGCIALGTATTVTVRLQVRDDENSTDTQDYTYTIREHAGRRYFLKDHLGSVRATVNRDGNVIGHDDYYPFGLTMPGRSSNSANPNDDYKFTGHERDDEAGLTIDYMGARNYDPIIARFFQIDPMYNQRYGLSPYNYAQNNPLVRIDPNGMLDILIQGANGSSVNIETDLVDISVDASSLGIDFGGNYSVGGADVVEAALDLGGILDPTGIIDATATAYYANKGDIGNTLISAVSILPFGDAAKLGKIGKHVKTITDAIGSAHGVRAGRNHTRGAVREAKRRNALKNNGDVVCTSCGVVTTPTTRRTKGSTVNPKEGQGDHIWPKSKGGNGATVEDQTNIDIKCASCNNKKSNKM